MIPVTACVARRTSPPFWADFRSSVFAVHNKNEGGLRQRKHVEWLVGRCDVGRAIEEVRPDQGVVQYTTRGTRFRVFRRTSTTCTVVAATCFTECRVVEQNAKGSPLFVNQRFHTRVGRTSPNPGGHHKGNCGQEVQPRPLPHARTSNGGAHHQASQVSRGFLRKLTTNRELSG